MNWLLNVVLALEILVAVLWTGAMATETGSSGIAVLGWFATVVVFYGVAFVIGAVVAWRRPALRRRASLVMAMPLIGGFAPYLLRAFAGGALSPAQLRNGVLAALTGVFVLGLVFPRRAVRLLPQAFFRSRGWNGLLVGALGLAWCVLIAALVWLFTQDGQQAVKAADRSSSGMATAYVVLFVSTYLLLLGLASFLTGAWGWLGLMGHVDGAQRGLHVAQLAAAVPGIMLAAATWVWLAGQR